MVIDTSALAEILFGEASAERLIASIDADERRLVSAATVVELTIVVLGRVGEAGEPQLDRLLAAIEAQIVSVDAEQAAIARDAALRYGLGHHRAGLNFGDCFSYALSVALGEPLLCTGEDFSQTDVALAPW